MALGGLLCDFGLVILKSPFELLHVFERVKGLPPASLDWRGPFDPPADELWSRLQAGELAEREYWRIRAEQALRAAGETGGVREFMTTTLGGPEEEVIRPEARALIDDARAAGVRTGILSNELRLFHGEEWMARMTILAVVDVIVDASDTGVLKPEPGAYRLALHRLRLPAHQVVFVDDQPANVEGARRVGMVAVHFDVTDPAGGFDAARALLGI